MRVLVLGGTGFIGPAIVRRLFAHGHSVSVFHRGKSSGDLPNGVEHVYGDIRNFESYADGFKSVAPQIVVDVIAGTREHAQTLIKTFRGIAQRVLVLSSGDVYFANDVLHGREPGPIQPTPLSETALLRKQRYPYRSLTLPAVPWLDLNDYEKMEVEEELVSDPELPATILRLPMVYGPGDYDGTKRRFYRYLKRMDDGREAILLDIAMAQWRAPWGYTENVAEAVALAVSKERSAGQVYNVCEVDRPTLANYVQCLGDVAGWEGRIITTTQCWSHDMSRDLNFAQDLDMDSSKIRAELGYREIVDRTEALSRTVAWEREHPPARMDPEQFDYAAEEAILASLRLKQSPGTALR